MADDRTKTIELKRHEVAVLSTAVVALQNADLMRKHAEATYRSALIQAGIVEGRYRKALEEAADEIRAAHPELNGVPVDLWDLSNIDTAALTGTVTVPESHETDSSQEAEQDS